MKPCIGQEDHKESLACGRYDTESLCIHWSTMLKATNLDACAVRCQPTAGSTCSQASQAELTLKQAFATLQQHSTQRLSLKPLFCDYCQFPATNLLSLADTLQLHQPGLLLVAAGGSLLVVATTMPVCHQVKQQHAIEDNTTCPGRSQGIR